jgi:predicted Fe-Mo cluster-binding NifX family protein
MKIAVSSTGTKIADQMDERFGRCSYFIVVDATDNFYSDVTAVPNQGALQGHGAGLKAAAQLGELKIEAIITGNLGPNAFQALAQMGIKAYQASGPVQQALDDFLAGKLAQISTNQEKHFGMRG